MLVAAAVCPGTPLLVPEVAAGAAGELAGLRAAAVAAVERVAATRPGLVVVAGDGPESLGYAPGDSGSFARYGVDLAVPLGPRRCAGQPVLPPALTVGAWLLHAAGWSGDVQGYAVARDAPPAAAAEVGSALAALDDRVGLLVVADGSAKRGEQAPGADDPRAAGFDGAIGRALAGADPPALLGLDPDLAAGLWCAGRAPLQALAGAAGAAGAAGDATGWTAELTFSAAPYGVAYFVSTWTRG